MSPCKFCGVPTTRPGALCSTSCQVEFYGFDNSELHSDDDERNPIGPEEDDELESED